MAHDQDTHHLFARFQRMLKSYLDAAHELRQLSDAIERGDLQAESIEARFEREAARLFPMRPEEYHEPAARLVHDKVHELMDRRKHLAPDAGDDARKQLLDAWTSELKVEITDLTGSPADFWIYSEVWSRVSSSRWGSHVLMASLLTTAIADFEVFVSRLITAVLDARPQILNESGRTFTLAEVRRFDSIADVEDAAIADYVDGQMSGGYEAWAEWLLKRGVKVDGVTREIEPRLIEAFQRRHVLVHSGGHVDSGYVNKVKSTPYKSGDPIVVEAQYLDRTLALLSASVLKLTFATMHHFFPMEDDVLRDELESAMEDETFNLLFHDRDLEVVDFETWALPLRTDNGGRLRAQVNCWLARKRLGDADGVRAEVEAWDATPLSGIYRLVRLALLGRDAEAHELARRLVESEELHSSALKTWPVLEGLRIYDAAVDDASARITTVAFEAEH